MKTNPDSPSTGVLRRIIQWTPQRIDPPRVDPDLKKLSEVQRSAEVFRYSILTTEYWLSPRGVLREWLRFNLLVGISLGIPALLIVPLATYLLTQFVTWTALLIQIAKNLAIFPIAALVAIALLTGAVFLLRVLLRR